MVFYCCLPLALAAQMVSVQGGGERYALWGDSTGSHVRQATITPFLTDVTSTAVIVFPGGSYFWLAGKEEGDDVGSWLQQQGLNAFVVRYRVPGWWSWFSHNRLFVRGKCHPDMYGDGQQALRWVFEHAAQFGIDTSKVGMMGFSAGGHLVAYQACCGDPWRPAFAASVYPVVTMSEPCVHQRSRRGLLGERWRREADLCDQLSVERHVPADCPPMFLVACDDDPVVNPRNAQLLDSALTVQSIPHRYIRYRTGGHGFGVSETKGSSESRQWKYAFLEWLKGMHYL